MGGFSFNINGAVFAKSFIMRKVGKVLEEGFTQLGPEKVDLLIKKDIDLTAFVSQEQWGVIREKAPQYSWAMEGIDHKDIYKVLPQWVKDIISANGMQGGSWFLRQCEICQKIMKGEM